jgi:hypothetical protein
MDFNSDLFRREHDKKSSKHDRKETNKKDHHDNSTSIDQDNVHPIHESTDEVDTLQSFLSVPKDLSATNGVDNMEESKKPVKMFDWNYLKAKASKFDRLNEAIRKEEENYSEYKYDTKSDAFGSNGNLYIF